MTPEVRAALDAILADNPIIPVLTIDRLDDAVPLARALVAGGVRALEITLRTPAAADAARRIIAEVPEAIVGLGTVRTRDDVVLAHKLGARFLVSPGTLPNVYLAARDAGLPFLPGVATASEVLCGLAYGYHVLKFFPAVPAGGIAALKAFAGPFSEARFCPTGGIGEANFAEWLALPNVAAVGGSWLAPPASIRSGDWAGITAIAQRSMSIALRTRQVFQTAATSR